MSKSEAEALDAVPDLDVANAPKRTTRKFDDVDAPEKSGQYVIDSWRISRPPPGADFDIGLAALARTTAPDLSKADPGMMEVPGLPPSAPEPDTCDARDAVLPPPPSLRTQTITEPRVAFRTAGDETASIAAFAGFGDVPNRLLATPSYAMRVFSRRWTLKRELAAARERGSRDVPVYEAALVSADDDSVQAGILVAVCVTVAVALAAIAVAAFVS